MKLTLIFKKAGEVTKRNLRVDDHLTEAEVMKYINQETRTRWPDLVGTRQKIEGYDLDK